MSLGASINEKTSNSAVFANGDVFSEGPVDRPQRGTVFPLIDVEAADRFVPFLTCRRSYSTSAFHGRSSSSQFKCDSDPTKCVCDDHQTILARANSQRAEMGDTTEQNKGTFTDLWLHCLVNFGGIVNFLRLVVLLLCC